MRAPRGKRVRRAETDTFEVASKNANGTGSVYFEPGGTRSDGSAIAGRWRATYVDQLGKRRRVTARTRAEVEAKREDALAACAAARPTSSRFTAATTVSELLAWWLEEVARHQVRTSTLDRYRKFASYLGDDLGHSPIADVRPETLTVWQSRLLDKMAPYTVLNCRKVCRQAFTEAVKLGVIAANPFDLVRPPRARRATPGRALSAEEARRLIVAAQRLRLGAAVTLLFCQGWRVSEVLGLAWEDIDLDAGTARVRRAAAYTPSLGVVLGSTKTSGAEGVHHLAPVSVAHLRRRSEEQAAERLAGWPEHRFEGELIHPVFTNLSGELVNRQAVTKCVEKAAREAGLDPAGLATHTGRRTVITALYAAGDVDLADVARHVGHVDPATTAGYVRDLGQRPRNTALRAAQLLDPTLNGE